MSFIQSAFAATPLHTPEEFMATFMRVADELDMPDKRGACICSAMCCFQEAGTGGNPRLIWTPGNDGDPCFAAHPEQYPHDSMGDDGRSAGPFQQQTSGPPPAVQWGWGGLYGDPEGTRKRMDAYESTAMFQGNLKHYGYDVSSPRAANDSVQRVQKSGAPDAYEQWWDEAQTLYDQVAAGAPSGGNQMVWTGDPVWLEDVLRPVLGNRLKTLPGWQNAGHGDFKDIRGVMMHHTGNSRETAVSIRNGRPDLDGPLANLHIAPNGDVTIVAVGVCWHAGAGTYPWLPTNNANWHMIGIECAWPDIAANGSYDPHQLWPDEQILSMRDTAGALLKKLGWDADRVIGHKDYAGLIQGKWDPGNLSTVWFQAEVGKWMRGEFADPTTAPVVPPVPPKPLPVDYQRQSWEQIYGHHEALGWQTLVQAVAELRDKLTGTNDAGKTGVKFDGQD